MLANMAVVVAAVVVHRVVLVARVVLVPVVQPVRLWQSQVLQETHLMRAPVVPVRSIRQLAPMAPVVPVARVVVMDRQERLAQMFLQARQRQYNWVVPVAQQAARAHKGHRVRLAQQDHKAIQSQAIHQFDGVTQEQLMAHRHRV